MIARDCPLLRAPRPGRPRLPAARPGVAAALRRGMGPGLSLVALAVTLAGCTPFPQLDDRLPEDAAALSYPDLVPLDPLLAGIAAPRITPQDEDALNARAARLRARAAALGAQVLPGDTRARMSAGVATGTTTGAPDSAPAAGAAD